MKEPVTPPEDHDMICPSCASKNISLDEDSEVTSTLKHEKLRKYKCEDCKAEFIPQMDNHSIPDKNIEKWANKVKLQEGMSEGKTWKKQAKDFIIITKKKKSK